MAWQPIHNPCLTLTRIFLSNHVTRRLALLVRDFCPCNESSAKGMALMYQWTMNDWKQRLCPLLWGLSHDHPSPAHVLPRLSEHDFLSVSLLTSKCFATLSAIRYTGQRTHHNRYLTYVCKHLFHAVLWAPDDTIHINNTCTLHEIPKNYGEKKCPMQGSNLRPRHLLMMSELILIY